MMPCKATMSFRCCYTRASHRMKGLDRLLHIAVHAVASTPLAAQPAQHSNTCYSV